MSRLHKFLAMVGTSVLVLSCCFSLSGQEVNRDQLDASLREWKEKYKQVIDKYGEFLTCEEDDAERIRDEWQKLKREGDELADNVIHQAMAVYTDSSIADPEIKRFLMPLVERYYEKGQYEMAAQVGHSLVQHDADNRALIFESIKSAFSANDFDLAADLVERWTTRFGDLPPAVKGLADLVPYYQKEWKREQDFRAADNKRDDNPLIEFETVQGKIVVELFEENAPNAVNLFVFLIENEFFVNMTFFQVWKHKWVWSGCPANNGTGAPKHGVKSEANSPEARRHFRGTLSLRVSSLDNTARSQFFIMRIPYPDFDGVNAVIGRVVEGMDVVDKLTTTHQLDQKSNPVLIEDVAADRLINVRVLRKRDHEYQPEISR